MPPLAARWRVLDSGAGDGATNMAVDHALLDRAAGSGEAVLRVYAWARPTLSFGMHERARISVEALRREGVDVVRRPTGGRALLHDHEVTYSVTAAIDGIGLSESYRAINALLVAALARLGVHATEAPRRRRPSAPDGTACFAEPNVGELVVGGRKLVGSAQRRDERALLQHGSILLEDDQPRIASLRGESGPSDGLSAAATLRGALGRPVVYAEVRDALFDALRSALALPCEPLDAEELASGVARHLPQYRDPAWTWRRTDAAAAPPPVLSTSP